MDGFINRGWNVEYVYSNPQPSGTFRRCGNPNIVATNDINILKTPCDIFLLASDDFVWEFGREDVVEMMSNINAERKVMYVNYRIGKIGSLEWSQGWDEYLFLSSLLETQFLKNLFKNTSGFQVKTKVLPPPTDLSLFYPIQIDYSGELKLIRHSSQGDSKYSEDFNQKVEGILEEFPKATIRLMPGPSFLEDFGDRVISHKRNEPPVHEFLKLGNLFWYDLPKGYTEGGPRVISESLASGLPVIAGSESGGAKDRVTNETGILCDSFEDQLKAMKFFDLERNREFYGLNAKEYTREHCDPERWIESIIGEG